LLGGCEPADQVALRCPKSRVYRLEVGKRGLQHSVVAKRLDPADAQRVRLVTERWLPAPKLLGDAPSRFEDGRPQDRGDLPVVRDRERCRPSGGGEEAAAPVRP
jgi:hypothetical protein